ncbi:signal transduction protein [Longimycelium tulufanense]|uniref:Signal transduction protein n=1 Tax=Longimycelium tulufanense TaxID=907463 RepID=A0A8J3C997_9PSEU|nr:EAL domain-containing protein [Longimycelium tulufanense]GGM33967.1 signal transduction protein [Longimycelium tulufanense]
MTLPLPGDLPVPLRELGTPAERARDRARVARKWAYLVSKTSYIPLPPDEVERQFLELVDRLFAAAGSEPFDPEPAAAVGARLVELNLNGRQTLQCTLDVLGKALAAHRPQDRVITLLGSVAAGYAEAMRASIFEQQENLSRALYRAVRDAERRLRVSEQRFEEVFRSAESGIAVTDSDGDFARANQAFARILGCPEDGLSRLNLFEVLHSDDAPFLRELFADLRAGRTRRPTQRRRMVRKDGEVVEISLTVALLRDQDGQPDQYVALVQDITDFHLLQDRLHHQSLHDALTGLPNRQYFTSKLETVLRRADPETGCTLYHLDLDAFSMVTDGLGREVGDRLLTVAAARLESVLAGERAMVARLGGDEFAILVENSPTTPDVVTMVTRINEELGEPIYVGDRGIAVSASIGVVDRPPRDMAIGELLSAADMTLRRAKSAGPRQWELFDPQQNSADRERFALAVTMPGAWEIGEVDVVYQPLVTLATEQGAERVAGLEAQLRWDHPVLGMLDHDRCVDLAEETGLLLPVGEALIQSAAKQLAWWRQRLDDPLPLHVSLTPYQASDPDLVAAVRRGLADTGLGPESLWLGMPVWALRAKRGEAMDNLEVLADMGTHVVVTDFGGAPGDLACLADLPVHGVRLAPWVAERLQRPPADKDLAVRALRELVALARTRGTTVIAHGLRTREHAENAHRLGVDIGRGDFWYPPGSPDEVAAALGIE